jgi:hypothetical protein
LGTVQNIFECAMLKHWLQENLTKTPKYSMRQKKAPARKKYTNLCSIAAAD